MSLNITSLNELNQVAPPALPQATDQYDRRYQDQLNNVLRLYFNRIHSLQQQLERGEPIDYLDFSTEIASHVHQLGRLSWDSTDETLAIDMEYGVVQQVGQETYARVQNSTGTDIPNGTVVGFAGATDNALLVAPYLADGSAPSLYVLGVITHDLPDSGQKGYCTTWGFVRGMDTSAFSSGDILYASPSVAGALTSVKPTAPNNVIPVAACVTSDATEGVIFVRPSIEQMTYYGVFAKTASQSPAAANTAYAVTFDSTTISNGVVIGTPTSRIVVPESGFYQCSCTLQISSGSSSKKDMRVWIRKNGTDIANSARLITSDVSGGYVNAILIEPLSLDVDDYIEIMFAANSTNMSLAAVPATAYAPAAPAAVLELTQVKN